jgi:hypothetical protein
MFNLNLFLDTKNEDDIESVVDLIEERQIPN